VYSSLVPEVGLIVAGRLIERGAADRLEIDLDSPDTNPPSTIERVDQSRVKV
jgi:hypothetical protein